MKADAVHFQAYELIGEGRTACRLLTDETGPLITTLWRHQVTCKQCKASIYYKRVHRDWPRQSVAVADA